MIQLRETVAELNADRWVYVDRSWIVSMNNVMNSDI